MMVTSEALSGAGTVRHAFFTREGGVSEGIYASLNCGFGSGDAGENVAANRERAMARLGLGREALVNVYQVHGTAVHVVDGAHPATPPEADALVTLHAGVALGILTADCAPVLFADAEAGVIGAAHAGWRGALAGVLDETVLAMERLGARRARTVVAVGPCIAQASYQVGPEFPAPFLAADPANGRFFAPEPASDCYRFDLEGYVVARLSALGLEAAEPASADTFPADAPFFSYRRSRKNGEPDYGRCLSAIALTG